MYLGSWKIDDLVTFVANTHTPSTGAATDADGAPAYRVYEDETGTPILTGTMALLDGSNTVGFYSEQITLSAANGFEKGKSYSIYISAAVGGVTGTMSHSLQIEAEVDANAVSSLNAGVITAAAIATGAIDADAIADNAIDAGAIAADAITAAKIADGAIDAATFAAGAITATVIATGAIDADAIADNAIDAGAIAADAITAAKIADNAIADQPVASVTGAVGSVTGSVGSVVGNVGGDVVGSVGSVAGDIGGLAAGAATDVENAVWDATLASHQAAGSTGEALGDASSAGDPWNTALPGAYGAGTAGQIVGDNLNATVSSRATQASVDTVDTVVDAILVDTGTDIPALLTTIAGYLDTEIAAIKAKTDQLTFTIANKVDASIQAAGDFAQAAADKVWSTAARTLTAFGFSVTVGTNNDKTGYALSAAGIQAIWDALTAALTTAGSIGKLLVDNINATISSRLASASYTTPPTATENADALLKRDMSAVTGEAARSPLNALRLLRNKRANIGGTLTVTKEDDTTAAWTAAVLTAASDPINSIDPS